MGWLGRCSVLALAVSVATVLAQPPKKEVKDTPPQVIVALPLAVELGKTTKVTLRGVGVDMATEVRFLEPRTQGKIGKSKKIGMPKDANPKAVGDSEIELEITLPAEVAGSVVPFSLVGPGGESRPHNLIIKDIALSVAERERNDGLSQAQPITPPCVVEGSIRQAQDVDVFRFEGKAGETYVIDLQANRFGSPVDGMLTLYDSAGRVIASSDDSAESTDPRLIVKLPRSGLYSAAVIDAHDQGGGHHLYRLVVRRQD